MINFPINENLIIRFITFVMGITTFPVNNFFQDSIEKSLSPLLHYSEICYKDSFIYYS